jgi:hypothetical protein
VIIVFLWVQGGAFGNALFSCETPLQNIPMQIGVTFLGILQEVIAGSLTTSVNGGRFKCIKTTT